MMSTDHAPATTQCSAMAVFLADILPTRQRSRGIQIVDDRLCGHDHCFMDCSSSRSSSLEDVSLSSSSQRRSRTSSAAIRAAAHDNLTAAGRGGLAPTLPRRRPSDSSDSSASSSNSRRRSSLRREASSLLLLNGIDSLSRWEESSALFLDREDDSDDFISQCLPPAQPQRL